MGKKYYKIISIAPTGIAMIIKRIFEYNQDEEICCINYKTSEPFDNNELYTGFLSESLETKEMERYIALCKKNNKQPSINKLFKKGFAFNGNKKNFLGFTNALIELKFSSQYEKRNIYYENGFYFNGVKYVRYKRSASSARNGKCLFIMEELHKKHMEKWSNCGIDPLTIDDLTSWEAYKGLTLSSIESTITLPYDSILIIKDKISCFKDYVATPFLDPCRQNVDIKNKIWDGEGLLDNSVFMNSDNADYSSSECSMLFLRGRFFKTCGFRTNLQLWFEDNHIDSISQINGFTLAKHPKDIKLVITESSLKYHQFINNSDDEDCSDSFLKTCLTQWITGQGININTNYKKKSSMITFGVVKTNHPTKYYNGKLVQTNYQLLNTLPIHYNDVQELLKPSFEYISLSKNSPTFFRAFINVDINSEFNKPEYDKEDSHPIYTSEFVNDNDPSYTEIDNTIGYRQFFINELMHLTNAFSGTKMYKDFQKKTFNNFRNKIRNGQILVEGTFATLFGNPAEFLYETLKVNNNHQLGKPLQYIQDNIQVTTPVLCGNEIFCKHFDDNIDLTCARSPHVTMGNLFVAKNRHIDFYTRYFILSKEIVCVNAIKYNLQHKLNGADYDSDAMLITNNPIIVSAAKEIDGIFPSPYNHLTPTKKKLDQARTLSSQLCDIDSLISDDQTGQIINLSQEMNSYIWDSCSNLNREQAKAFLRDDVEGKYDEVCQLAILSNIALDRAKRNYDRIISEVLNPLRQSEILYRTTPKGNIFIQERPIFLQKLLGLKPSDYTAEIVNLYRFITKSEKELKISRSKSEPDAYMMDFGENIAVHKYEIKCLDEEPYILYSVAVNKSLNCTMSYIFDILIDKEYEKNINSKIKNYLQTQDVTLNSTSIKLTDLIETPKVYRPALEYAEEVKEIVKLSYNEQRKIANRKHLDEKEKHILRSEIIDKCLSDVNDLLRKHPLHIEYLIYVLLKDIDEINLLTQEDKDNKLVAYSSLLFSCICNHTRENKYIFYDMVNKKAIHSSNNPTDKIVEDEDGNIYLLTIPHSIKKSDI